MSSKILIFFVFLLGNKLCQADLAEDAEAALNDFRKVNLDLLTFSFLEHTKMTSLVNQAALDTKASSFKLFSTKTDELVSVLEKAKISNPAKFEICQKSLSQLSKTVADDIATCVDQQADEAINLLYGKSSALTYSGLEIIYDEEKAIIFCGRSDTDCLSNVIEDINTKASAIPDIVNQQVADDYNMTDEQIELIKSCAAKAEDKLNNFDNKCVF